MWPCDSSQEWGSLEDWQEELCEHVRGDRGTLVSLGKRLAPGCVWAQSPWLYSFIESNESLGFENRKHFEIL